MEPINDGARWHLKSNPRRVATVISCRNGYVRFRANWTKRGTAGKGEDTFRKFYVPATPNAEVTRADGAEETR